MNYKQIITNTSSLLLEVIAIVALVTVTFVAIEPVVSRAAVENFTVTQAVSGAIAFAASTTPNPVVMVGTLDGLTGGTSYGTTTVRVTTNNAGGYSMTIQFSSTTAMIRNGTTKSEIKNYTYSTGTASYPAGFDTTLANGQFGFSVNASNTSDVSSVFTGTQGTACGTGAGSSLTVNDCWRGASTTAAAGVTELINRTTPTPSSGSTSTIQFRITIPNNPSPAIPNGNYTATATLTAVNL